MLWPERNPAAAAKMSTSQCNDLCRSAFVSSKSKVEGEEKKLFLHTGRRPEVLGFAFI